MKKGGERGRWITLYAPSVYYYYYSDARGWKKTHNVKTMEKQS